MAPASPLTFPGSRSLAAWWKHLSSPPPRRLWVGHLLLHHVEALARVSRSCRPDRIALLALKALALKPGEEPAALAQGLHLDRPFFLQVLKRLESEGLARPDRQGQWSLTARGQVAHDRGDYPRPEYERRAFHFVESEQEGRPPHFLKLNNPTGLPWPAAAEWRFDVANLTACLTRPEDWKRHHGFPLDVEEVLGLGGGSVGAEATQSEGHVIPSSAGGQAWQRVILDRPERLPALLALVPAAEGGDQLLGFPLRQEDWTLAGAEPVFAVGAGWQEVFPELAEDPPPEVWREAWKDWCRLRGLPENETAGCTLRRRDHLLTVSASHRMVERLRAMRSDAVKGEAWVPAGAGRFRAAALLEVREEAKEKFPDPGSRV